MRIAIIGAGAVGTWYGGWLAMAGHDVVLVARGQTLEFLREHPVTLRNSSNKWQVRMPVVDDLLSLENVDAVFLATKSLHGSYLPDQLPDGAVLVTMQNSVEMPQLAIEKFGAHRVIPAVVRAFLTKTAIGETLHDGNLQSLTFGSVDPATQRQVLQLEQAFAQTPISPIVVEDILADVWRKAMFVTSLGLLGALVGQPAGVLRTRYRTSLENLMREVQLVAAAHGVELGADAVERMLEFVDKQDGLSTTSMQRDIMAKSSNELDAQAGAIVRMAEQVGIEPVGYRLAVEALSI